MVEHCVTFCQALRDRGIPVTPSDAVTATQSLGLIDVGDREDVRLSLRAALVRRREIFPLFDEVFERMWNPADIPRDRVSGTTNTSIPPADKRAPHVTLSTWMRGGDEARETRIPVRTPSDRETRGTGDFATFDREDSAAFERLAARIARRLALRPSRRWEAARAGARVDLRRTIRNSLRTGGEAGVLEWRNRKIRRTRLVAICDVSGSMEPYARFVLQFLHALQNSFAQIETFVFSTKLTRTTALLRHRAWNRALSGVARDVSDWSGGTRIGASLERFADEWMKLVDSRTIVIIMSDGWETGDPAVLGSAMERIHKRAGRVIWLNPLMVSPDYAPETRGMVAALPHLDIVAPAHNIASMENLLTHLAL